MIQNEKRDHLFIFKPGIWLGEGLVKLSVSKDNLKFATRWTIDKKKKSQIITTQEIEIYGLSDKIKNQFCFYNIKADSFKIRLENQDLGEVLGQGIIKKDLIAWEFKVPSTGFEGFEVYNLQEDNSYALHAEYTASADFRTCVRGKIWEKVSQ